MHIQFSKYQGTGNDFIMLNNLNGEYNELNIKQIQFLCDRKFGVGADGLIKLNSCASAAFEVEYFNADGTKSFCGNGARCSVRFAEQIGFTQTKLSFMAIDGLHSAVNHGDLIALDMMEVEKIEEIKTNEFVLNTGSPHYIKYVTNSLETNVVESGRKIRYSPQFKEEGINVNFVESYNPNEIEVCTYERGVEDETLSCGTGVVAAAIAQAHKENLNGKQLILIHTKGGKLQVEFIREINNFKEIKLIGPAQHVFDGSINL